MNEIVLPSHHPEPPGAGGHAGPWMLGFHGVVEPAHLRGASQPSFLRALALSRRSLGTQSLTVLTSVVEDRATRAKPLSANGSRAITESGQHEGVVADHWDGVEPVASYLDRRLGEASVVYLPNRSRSYAAVTRIVDVVGASVLLVLASPLLLALVILIRLDSPGPAIFRQPRVTVGGRVFTFYKFRTMWVDARERFPALYDYRTSTASGEVFYKLADDPRCTRVGRWLRRTTVDELPNLVNVLRGDMSLVGPRPELPELLGQYRNEDLALLLTKAGVTGLAQIAGRSLLTVRERITIDLRYLAQQTVLLDLRILAHTVLAVLLGRGAF